MASALRTEFTIQERPYDSNYGACPTASEGKEQARQQMRQEKIGLQTLISEYYCLLLDEYERSISRDKPRGTKLNRLLEKGQQHLDDQGQIPSPVSDETLLLFWCQFQTTIEQYCRLQQRLYQFPSTLSQWQMEKGLPQSAT